MEIRFLSRIYMASINRLRDRRSVWVNRFLQRCIRIIRLIRGVEECLELFERSRRTRLYSVVIQITGLYYSILFNGATDRNGYVTIERRVVIVTTVNVSQQKYNTSIVRGTVPSQLILSIDQNSFNSGFVRTPSRVKVRSTVRPR